VVIVHNLGNIVNVPRLKRIRPDLVFVEDNCEGLFGKYEKEYTGTAEATLCSAVSFYGNKTITTGEGGAFFTNDLEVYKYIKTFYSHGMSDIRYVHNIQGTNYRMTNIQAAFLYDQMNDIDHILMRKAKVFANYESLMEDLVTRHVVRFLKKEANVELANWMFVIRIPGMSYDAFETYMSEKNIQVRPLFFDIHTHQHLQNIIKPLEDSVVNIGEGAMLPSYPELSLEDQEYIVQCVREFCVLHDLLQG
jgi:perosamine synthetase